MDDQTPTAVIKIIQKLKSETGTQRMSSSSMMNTSSVSSIGALNESGMDDFLSPKRQRLNSGSFSYDQQAPPSPWEWRRLKGEVNKHYKQQNKTEINYLKSVSIKKCCL